MSFFSYSVKACSCMNCPWKGQALSLGQSDLWSPKVTLPCEHGPCIIELVHSISRIRFDCLWQKIHDIVHKSENSLICNNHGSFQRGEKKTGFIFFPTRNQCWVWHLAWDPCVRLWICRKLWRHQYRRVTATSHWSSVPLARDVLNVSSTNLCLKPPHKCNVGWQSRLLSAEEC